MLSQFVENLTLDRKIVGNLIRKITPGWTREKRDVEPRSNSGTTIGFVLQKINEKERVARTVYVT
jgi:hypothetical protein